MTANIGAGRLLRVCDLCGGVDDHPRHTIAGTVEGQGVVQLPDKAVADKVLAAVFEGPVPREDAERLLRDLYDTGTSDRHMDCCRTAGCPDGTCDLVTAGAEDKRGKQLLAHLTAKGK